MKRFQSFFLIPLALLCIYFLASCSGTKKVQGASADGWISLFDGKTLNGWKASESQTTYSVENGAIVGHGPRSHLYYMGPVMNHDFKNFEFRAKVMTKPGSNSGLYFQTKFQPAGFPDSGFEVQINNSSGDWRRTGCLYDIKDFKEKYAKDNEWFTLYFKVQGKHVIIKVNDKQVIDWTQPENFTAPKNHVGRYISSGTFALQMHDTKSTLYFKDIEVKPLPD